MIKEFKDGLQAKAIAESLGLFITKHKGVYIVSNNISEIVNSWKYKLEYNSKENIFYDNRIFRFGSDGFLHIKDLNIIDASVIEIPYNLKNCSYIFFNCTSLKVPPKIPKGVINCYSMFWGCASLETPPEIPDGVTNCHSMFYGCPLVTPPVIPESVTECSHMFNGCSALKTPPKLPRNLRYCSYMFMECTSLESSPEIPESLVDYYYMFQGCTALKEPPRLPENWDPQFALKDTPFERM